MLHANGPRTWDISRKYVQEPKGFSVTEEPRIRVGTTFRKPDLVAFKQGSPALASDSQVLADSFNMDASHQLKIDKYNRDAVRRGILLLGNEQGFQGVTDIEHHPVTINLGGCMHPRSARGLLGLGFSLRELSVLSVKVLTWTFIIVQAYNLTGSRARRRIHN